MQSRKRTLKRIPAGFREVAKNIRQGELGRAVTSATQPTQAQSVVSGKDETPDLPALGAHTEIQTVFTKPGQNLKLYTAEGWVKIRMLLETAGPVTVSTRQDVLPVLSGKGILLPTDVEVTFPMPKGDRLYIASSSVNRVRFIVEPIPWQEQLANMTASILKKLAGR